MSTLTVWKFSTPDGAERCFAKLPELQKQNLIEVEDAAIVTWPAGKKKPKTQQVIRKFQTGLRPEMYAKGAMGGPIQEAFWSLPGLSNRYQWDIVTPDGDLFKAGVGGQGLYISPSHDAVVCFFSTGTMIDENLGAWVARHITQSFS
jgi:hypothetical protein